jgi:acyl homoserine lactone synthase
MLENNFSCLLHGQPAKKEMNIWELSRFALKQVASRSYGFSEATLGAMRSLVEWASRERITEFLTVTTVAVYRMMASIGLDVELYGPPIKIGSVMTVAMRIHLSHKTWDALFGEQRKIA